MFKTLFTLQINTPSFRHDTYISYSSSLKAHVSLDCAITLVLCRITYYLHKTMGFQVAAVVRNSQHFMLAESSVPYSKPPAPSVYTEPDESSPPSLNIFT